MKGLTLLSQNIGVPNARNTANNLYEQKNMRVKTKCVTNLCKYCKKTELVVISRYLQVKTSEGKSTEKGDVREFSFHPKIRYDMGKEVFYVWIAIFDNKIDKICHFYVLNTKDVKKFDNINLPTYQITNNQKTTLKINKNGVVLNKGKDYDYSCFNARFYNEMIGMR
jgi:hypothetical protein